ncbi:MAG: class I adenylate-forming enzyme family protein, partial [Acidimicrobiia bacterium]
AILKLGAVVVPMNPAWTAAELEYPIADADVAALITEASQIGKAREALAHSGQERVVVCTDDSDGAAAWSSLSGRTDRPPAVDLGPDDDAFVCYTSGTTGFPKGAILTHGSIRDGALGRVMADGITWRDVMLIPVPLAFTGGCISFYMQMCLVPGATAVLEASFDPSRVLDLIETEKVTMITSVPVVLQMLLDDPKIDTTDISSLWSLSSGGAPVPIPLLQEWQRRGVRMTQAYGQTETSGGCVYLNGADAADHIGSTGRPMLHTEVRIVDADDRDVPVGESGQILVRGPSLMKGYLNQPEATAAALRDGWMHTGDIGRFDEDGFLYVLDRQKDMLISGGANVYPAEIERALGGLPGLSDLAVIGVPDDRWGETPMIVVPHLDDVDVTKLAEVCATSLARYKHPRYLYGWGGPLPRTLSGKVQKHVLRAEADLARAIEIRAAERDDQHHQP